MDTLKYLAAGLLPYVVLPVFIIGMLYRVWVWIKIPQPAKMTLFPAADSTLRGVVAETLLFPSLFKGDRVLWAFSWLFHATLALVFLGHIRIFTGVIDRMLLGFGMTQDGIDHMSSTSGGIAGIVLLATGLLLFIRRLALPRVRQISGFPDFLATLLLIVIIVTGDWIRFSGHFDLEQTRIWTVSLLRFSPLVPESGMFLLHLVFAQLLIVYIPFSKILHFGGIFFTQALIKRS